MTAPRKHHFLPQFYLRGFSIDQRGIYQINKKTAKFYGCQIKDTAAVRDFHELDGDGTVDPNALEKELANLEGHQAQALQRVISDGISNEQNRISIVKFLSIMRMRVPAIKEHISKTKGSAAIATLHLLKKQGKLPKPPKGMEEHLQLKNINIEVKNWKCLEVMFKMGTSEKVLKILASMRMTLLRAPTGSRFITSDQPVALFHPTLFNSPSGVGPATPGVEVTFPLSSHALLKLDHLAREHEERIATSDEVIELNRRTMVMAQDFLYTGENPQDAASSVLEVNGKYAGFTFDDIYAGNEFIQVHRFIPVGPATH